MFGAFGDVILHQFTKNSFIFYEETADVSFMRPLLSIRIIVISVLAGVRAKDLVLSVDEFFMAYWTDLLKASSMW